MLWSSAEKFIFGEDAPAASAPFPDLSRFFFSLAASQLEEVHEFGCNVEDYKKVQPEIQPVNSLETALSIALLHSARLREDFNLFLPTCPTSNFLPPAIGLLEKKLGRTKFHSASEPPALRRLIIGRGFVE